MLEEPLSVYDSKKQQWIRRNVRFQDKNGKMYFVKRSKFFYSKTSKLDLRKKSNLHNSFVAPSPYCYRTPQPNYVAPSCQQTYLFYIQSKDGKKDLWINFNSPNQLSQWISKIRSSLDMPASSSYSKSCNQSYTMSRNLIY